jgi:hypothetical protein
MARARPARSKHIAGVSGLLVTEFADETPIRRLAVVRAPRATSADLGRLDARRAEAFAGVAASIRGDSAPMRCTMRS